MERTKHPFKIRHGDRDLDVWRRGRGHFKQYQGAINGNVCAIAFGEKCQLAAMGGVQRHIVFPILVVGKRGIRM